MFGAEVACGKGEGEMKGKLLPVVALAGALVALVLAIVTLTRTGPCENTARLEELADAVELTEVRGSLDSLSAESKNAAESARALGREMGRLSARIDRLEGELAKLAERPQAAVAIDDEKLGAIVREQMQQMWQDARARFAAGGGAAGGRQGRGDLAKVGDVAKAAARNAVEGFKIDHAHDGGKDADGKPVFTFHGPVAGKRGEHEVKVNAEGKVISENSRRRGGRRRPQGGQRPQQQPAPAPEVGNEAF